MSCPLEMGGLWVKPAHRNAFEKFGCQHTKNQEIIIEKSGITVQLEKLENRQY